MSSHTQRIVLSLLVLAFTTLKVQYARERSSPVPMNEYERTLKALNQYRALAAEDDGRPLPDLGVVKPGDAYSGVPRLIQLLSHLGDLPAGLIDADSELYDGPVVDAVKRFQARHELETDGIIGPATLEQLNTPLS